MERKLSNWLEGYLEYTEETESSPIFNKWVGVSTLASALRKKTWLELGRLKVFPNLYIVLVAEPGVARKSQAISYATSIIREVPSIVTAADSTTAHGLMQELEESTCYDRLPDNSPMRHASLSVISKEFESFLGSAGSTKMITTLTDLFDSGEETWRHRTKSSGISTIPSVFLNILGATTPSSLRDSLQGIAVGGGLTSRILFVYSEKKHKKIAIPELTPRLLELKELLVHDLQLISEITGGFQYTPDALDFWKEWYEAYDESSKERLQPKKEFDGWYSRKPLLLQKMCLILASSKTSDRLIRIQDIEAALDLLYDAEKGMGIILPENGVREVNKVTGNTYQYDLIFKYVKQYKQISEKHLLQLIWREVDEEELDCSMKELISKDLCEIRFKSPEGKNEIWYHIKEEVSDES